MHALIIEDEALTAFMLRDMLGECGFTEFDIATTEESAVALARLHPPDLITTDIRLEQGTGAGAVQQISRHSKAPVIFITGNPEAVEGHRGCAVLVKPISDDDLKGAVEQALGRHAEREPTGYNGGMDRRAAD